jgi:DNA-binding transcriptional MocR family regulator
MLTVWIQLKGGINMDEFLIKFSGKKSKYKELQEHIKHLIISGALPHHYKLPSIRKLANKLDVNPVTIVNCYKSLEREGYVYTISGGGTYVIADNNLTNLNEDFIDQSSTHNIKYDLASSSPSPLFFPVKTFKNLLNEVLERDGGFAFNYQESEGYLPLRQSLQSLLTEYKIKVSHHYIHVITGGQQGLDVIAKTLLQEGDYVFTEEPCYPGAIATFSSRGAKVIGIPIREKGIDLVILEKELKKYNPKFIYVMPDFQSPTGYLYDLTHRKKLLELANKYSFTIVEDDHFADLNYSQTKLPPLKALDINDNVIYIKSFSKVFMPGLRLALLVAPPLFNEPLQEAKQFSDISTSGFLQRTFDLYLRKGLWNEHVNKVKLIYQRRCQSMLSALERHFPSCVKFSKPQGGLSIWVQLPEILKAKELQKVALKKGISITIGDDFFIQRKENFFRLSFTNLSEKEIEKPIKELASIIKGML